MEKRPLGRTGMLISPVGFGAWATGGGGWRFGWGAQDDRDSTAAIRHAVDLGINWIDTAPIYGLGHSEVVVAQALRDFAPDDRPYVFTKCGLGWNPDRPQDSSQRIGNSADIRKGVEGSLKRLGVERLDLLQMHWPAADGTALEEYWSTMAALKAEGKVRAIGLSNHDVGQMQAAEKIAHVETLQAPFSAIKRDIANSELPWCAENKTGVLIYSPMQSGLLTGSFTRERAAALGADDWRSTSPLFRGEALEKNLEVARVLTLVAEQHNCSAGAIAVAWALEWRGVTGAICGARSAGQVDGWIDGATIRLDEEEERLITGVILTSRAGSGPVTRGSGGPIA